MKRTHLPLNGLRVLDAAARHLSFTRAADELAVTPAAVGQQIRALEDVLGTVLFRRTPKGLELTPEGESGLEALRAGFLSFEEAVRAMQAGQSSQSIAIAATRDVTAHWLAPRLAAYRAANPDVRFVIHSSDDGLDFTEANLDLAICFSASPGSHEGEAIGPRGFAVVGSGETIGWPDSPESAGDAIAVTDAGLAIDAARAGLGRAIVPALLLETDPTIEDPRGYWVVAPTPQWRQKKVKALVAFLTA